MLLTQLETVVAPRMRNCATAPNTNTKRAGSHRGVQIHFPELCFVSIVQEKTGNDLDICVGRVVAVISSIVEERSAHEPQDLVVVPESAAGACM